MGGGGGNAAYLSTVMRLAAVLKDPRVRSEGGKAAVENAAAALLRDARSLATGPLGSPGRDASPSSPEKTVKAASASAAHAFVDSASDGGSKHVYRLQCFADVNLSVTSGDVEGGDGTKRGASGASKKTRRPDPFPAVHIGDPLHVSCVLTSHLPEAVTLDALVLEMVVDGGGGGGGGGGASGVWNVQPPTEASAGGRGSGGGEQSSHRRSSPKRSKSLRRLESVKTVGGGDGDPSPAGSPDRVGSTKMKPPPPVTTSSSALGTASQSLVTSRAGGEPAAESAAAAAVTATTSSSSGFQVPTIRTTRSHSLSPRISGASSSAADLKEPLVKVPSGKVAGKPSRPPRSGGRDRSRSPARHSTGTTPPSSPFRSSSGSGSRITKVRARPACTGRIEGPVELLPGDTEVVFTLRPTVAGVLTASRVSAVWGGVTLIEALCGGGRGRGASGVSLPSAWVGVPRPPPSAVVRPFLPRAVLEVVPPNFLPLGNEGWLRVTVKAGPDTLRGARLRVAAGRGLAWGPAGASRVKWLHSGGDTEGVEQPAHAEAEGDDVDMLVDLQEALRPGDVTEISLRVRSTAELTAAGGRAAAVAPRSCVLKAELLAWHSRCAPSDAAGASGNAGGPGTSEVWGVECRTFTRTGITPRLPFEARVTVTERQAGVVFSQAALVCTSPVALSLRSCELCRLEPGAEVLSDPNAFLDGEVLPPGQPLRLAACLRRPSAATATCSTLAAMSLGGSAKSTDAGGVPLAVHRLRYSIEPAAGGGGGSGNKPAELFVFDVCIPNPSAGRGTTSPGGSRAAGTARMQRSLMTTVRPCDCTGLGAGDGDAGGAGGGEDGVLHLKMAEPRAFEFGVADGGDAPDGSSAVSGQQFVTYQVVASPSDWMVSGLVRGTARLEMKVRVLCSAFSFSRCSWYAMCQHGCGCFAYVFAASCDGLSIAVGAEGVYQRQENRILRIDAISAHANP